MKVLKVKDRIFTLPQLETTWHAEDLIALGEYVELCEAPFCENTFHQPSTGRRRKFCSSACKFKAFRARKQPST